VVVGLVLTLLAWIVFHSSVNHKMSSVVVEILAMQDRQDDYAADIRKLQGKLSKLKEEASPLENSNNEMLKWLQAFGDDVDTETSVYKEAEKVENTFLSRIDEIEAGIQKRSRRDVVLRYGEGPTYRINVTLTEETGPRSGRWFVVETAPISLMPHAVDVFTRMAVEYKLYDGLTLLLSSQSSSGKTATGTSTGLVQTVDISADTHEFVSDNHYRGKMPEHFIPRLAFAEHSEEYPVEKYSVVFSGRPGGPHFYINMNDKRTVSESHSQVEGGGPSCFGKVVRGRIVLDRIMQGTAGGSESSSSPSRKNVRMHGIESVRMIPPS